MLDEAKGDSELAVGAWRASSSLTPSTLLLDSAEQLGEPATVARLTIGLALTHVHDLGPVLAEFARVLRPGGHLVISESPGLAVGTIGFPLVKAGPDGKPGLIRNRRHETSDYLAAALPLGLQVRSCAEPRLGYPMMDPDERPPTDPVPLPANTPPDIWSLHRWCAAATNAAYQNQPSLLLWHFQFSSA